MSRRFVIMKTPRWIDIGFCWPLKSWAFEKVLRFNSGNPYISYRVGPLFIRIF